MISCTTPIVKYQKNVYKNFVMPDEIYTGYNLPTVIQTGRTHQKRLPHRRWCNSLFLSWYDE